MSTPKAVPCGASALPSPQVTLTSGERISSASPAPAAAPSRNLPGAAASPHPPRLVLVVTNQQPPTVFACGCCTGSGVRLGRPRCVCAAHADLLRGELPQVCEYHDADYAKTFHVHDVTPTRNSEAAGNFPVPAPVAGDAEVVPSSASSALDRWINLATGLVVLAAFGYFGAHLALAVHAGRLP